jgi:phospholipid transport system transporter-binding protein
MTTATAARNGDTLAIVGELDFASVADLWESTQPLFQAEPIRRIDLSSVHRSNSAGVALLAAWLHTAHHDQRQLVFVNVPAQMRAIIQVAGLETILPLA